MLSIRNVKERFDGTGCEYQGDLFFGNERVKTFRIGYAESTEDAYERLESEIAQSIADLWSDE